MPRKSYSKKEDRIGDIVSRYGMECRVIATVPRKKLMQIPEPPFRDIEDAKSFFRDCSENGAQYSGIAESRNGRRRFCKKIRQYHLNRVKDPKKELCLCINTKRLHLEQPFVGDTLSVQYWGCDRFTNSFKTPEPANGKRVSRILEFVYRALRVNN